MNLAVIELAWKETLGLSKSEWDLTFSDLGGTSLQANQLVARLSKELSCPISVLRVFEFPTLRQFARHLCGDHAESETLP
ncbi:MAG: acyl carrier protein, partial [Bdellovibrionota bacterium]